MDLIAQQLEELRGRVPAASLERSPEGHQVLLVPGCRLGPGWSQEAVGIRFLIPAGFPHVQPDCFYVDPELRLASGAEPANSSIQAVFGGQFRWFSWHLASWDPLRGTLDRYLRFCQRRLGQAR